MLSSARGKRLVLYECLEERADGTCLAESVNILTRDRDVIAADDIDDLAHVLRSTCFEFGDLARITHAQHGW